MATGVQGSRFTSPSAPQMAELGTTEHALMCLVLIELAALVLIRRAFKTAHGG